MVLQPRQGLSFVTDLSSSIHGWKNQFFFISSPFLWSFSSCWGDPRTGPNENSRMEIDDRKDFHRLKDMAVPPQRELMIEKALYDAGLSSVTSLGIT